MSEFEIVTDTYRKLKKINLYEHIVLEVPFMSRSIDMVLIDSNKRIITIEFKLHDWRSAVKQAKDHEVGSDESYICIPIKNKFSEKMLDLLEETGIGLMAYNKDQPEIITMIKPYEQKINKVDIWTDSLRNRVNDVAGMAIV